MIELLIKCSDNLTCENGPESHDADLSRKTCLTEHGSSCSTFCDRTATHVAPSEPNPNPVSTEHKYWGFAEYQLYTNILQIIVIITIKAYNISRAESHTEKNTNTSTNQSSHRLAINQTVYCGRSLLRLRSIQCIERRRGNLVGMGRSHH